MKIWSVLATALFLTTGIQCLPPPLINGEQDAVHQSFFLNNEQEGSFAFLFDRRGQKSFDFQDWKGTSPMTITSIAVLNAHLFTTPEDALIVYENSFGAGGNDDVNIVFKHADFKLTCQRDRRINSVARITTHNAQFYLVRQINCETSALTAQDRFILSQGLHHV